MHYVLISLANAGSQILSTTNQELLDKPKYRTVGLQTQTLFLWSEVLGPIPRTFHLIPKSLSWGRKSRMERQQYKLTMESGRAFQSCVVIVTVCSSTTGLNSVISVWSISHLRLTVCLVYFYLGQKYLMSLFCLTLFLLRNFPWNVIVKSPEPTFGFRRDFDK